MVLALARPEPEESQSEFSSRFLTQKELDPDFVDFNSVNRRYHFPARFYLPFRAGFGQSDPLLGILKRGVWRFSYAMANPVQSVDPKGELSVDIRYIERTGCSRLKVELSFQLSLGAPCDGYLVMKNEIDDRVTDCNGTPISPFKRKVFWEAWPVYKGEWQWSQVKSGVTATDRMILNISADITDIVLDPDYQNSYGFSRSDGELRFYCRTDTGDLGDYKKQGKAPGWGPGKAVESGDLPSTGTEPEFWQKDPVEGPVYRLVHQSWSCCDKECGVKANRYREVTFWPPPHSKRGSADRVIRD